MAPIGVARARRLQPGETAGLEPKVGSLALDREREIELGLQTEIEVHLDRKGPLTIVVGEVKRQGARRGLLNGSRTDDSR
jgi:hypothetical protein